MTTPGFGSTSRREFVKNAGRLAAAGALMGVRLPHVHAGEDNTIQVALVGCGGRGTGAAQNALSVNNGPIKLVAMADVFPNRLQDSLSNLKKDEKIAGKTDVAFKLEDGKLLSGAAKAARI